MIGTIPKVSEEEKHNYKTVAECQDGQERPQNCSENGRGSDEIKQGSQA